MCFVKFCNINTFDVRRDSSVGTATRYVLDGGGEIFPNRPDWPWGRPILLYTGHRVILRGKAAGAWRSQPPPSSSAEVNGLPYGFSWQLIGSNVPVR